MGPTGRRCGVAGGERVPLAPLGWYFGKNVQKGRHSCVKSEHVLFVQSNIELTLFPSTRNNQNFWLNTNQKLEFDTEDQVLFYFLLITYFQVLKWLCLHIADSVKTRLWTATPSVETCQN